MTHFEVGSVHEFRDGRELVARYHPGFAYRFTDRNRLFVGALVEGGHATPLTAERHAQLSARNGMVRGSVEVG